MLIAAFSRETWLSNKSIRSLHFETWRNLLEEPFIAQNCTQQINHLWCWNIFSAVSTNGYYLAVKFPWREYETNNQWPKEDILSSSASSRDLFISINNQLYQTSLPCCLPMQKSVHSIIFLASNTSNEYFLPNFNMQQRALYIYGMFSRTTATTP